MTLFFIDRFSYSDSNYWAEENLQIKHRKHHLDRKESKLIFTIYKCNKSQENETVSYNPIKEQPSQQKRVPRGKKTQGRIPPIFWLKMNALVPWFVDYIYNKYNVIKEITNK